MIPLSVSLCLYFRSSVIASDIKKKQITRECDEFVVNCLTVRAHIKSSWMCFSWFSVRKMASGTPYFSGYPADYTFTQPQEPPKPESPKPPKRPLTPYMRFSKSVSSRERFCCSMTEPSLRPFVFACNSNSLQVQGIAGDRLASW